MAKEKSPEGGDEVGREQPGFVEESKNEQVSNRGIEFLVNKYGEYAKEDGLISKYSNFVAEVDGWEAWTEEINSGYGVRWVVKTPDGTIHNVSSRSEWDIDAMAVVWRRLHGDIMPLCEKPNVVEYKGTPEKPPGVGVCTHCGEAHKFPN